MLACGLAVTLQRRQEIKIMEMEKTYNPAAIEEKIYDRWLQKKYFHAEVDRSKKPFTIVMPAVINLLFNGRRIISFFHFHNFNLLSSL